MEPLPKNPWQERKRIGGLSAFFRNTVEIIINPFEYFERLDIRDNYQEALILIFYNSLFLTWPFIKKLQSLPHFIGFLGTLVFVPAGIFIISLFIKIVLARLGEHAGFRKSFLILAFSSPVFIWALVPVAGYWLAAIAFFAVAWIGLVTVHNISFLKILVVVWLASALVILPYGSVHFVEAWRAKHPVIDPQEQALQTLMALGTLAEQYAKEHHGRYPEKTADVENNPCGKVQNGYHIHCEFRNYGYQISALPQGWKGWGLKAFTLRNGLVLKEIQP